MRMCSHFLISLFRAEVRLSLRPNATYYTLKYLHVFGRIFGIPECLEENTLTDVGGEFKIPYCITESLPTELQGDAKTFCLTLL